jgi:hypothetical protein
MVPREPVVVWGAACVRVSTIKAVAAATTERPRAAEMRLLEFMMSSSRG